MQTVSAIVILHVINRFTVADEARQAKTSVARVDCVWETEIPHDCVRPPAIITNFAPDYHPNYIYSHGPVIFLLAGELEKQSTVGEQNKKTFIRSHALINRQKQQLGALTVSMQMIKKYKEMRPWQY